METLIARPTVRLAQADDRAAVLVMAQHFLASTPYGADAGGDAIGRLVDLLVTRPDLGCGFVMASDTGLVGMIGVVLFPHLLSGACTAAEVVWWVEPEARTTRAGVQLLAAAEAWARRQGATIFQMGSWNDDLDRFYARRGFHPRERLWEKSLEE